MSRPALDTGNQTRTGWNGFIEPAPLTDVTELGYQAIDRVLAGEEPDAGAALAALCLDHGHDGLITNATNWARILLANTPENLRGHDGSPRVEHLLPTRHAGNDQARAAVARYVGAWHTHDGALAQRIYAEQATRTLHLCQFLTQLLFATANAISPPDRQSPLKGRPS